MNLLSPASKSLWKQAQRRREFVTFGVWLLLLEIGVSFGVLFLTTELKSQTSKFQRESVSTTAGTNSEQKIPLSQKTNELNTWLTVLKREVALDFPWPLLLGTIDQAAPSGIGFHTLNLSLATHALSLSGHADTRDELIAFQEALIALPSLSNVNSPITNLLKRDNIEFSMTATFTAPTP